MRGKDKERDEVLQIGTRLRSGFAIKIDLLFSDIGGGELSPTGGGLRTKGVD